jgi:hypothetical protein
MKTAHPSGRTAALNGAAIRDSFAPTATCWPRAWRKPDAGKASEQEEDDEEQIKESQA